MDTLFEYRDDTLYYHHTVDKHPNPNDFSMHAHEQLEVYCFISGRGKYFVEGNEYPLQSYDLMIMRSAETHRLIIEPGAPYERIAMHFPSNIFESVDPDHRLLRPFLERPLGQGNLYAAWQYPHAHWRTAFTDFNLTNSAEVRVHLLGRLLTILPELCDAFDRRNVPNSPSQGSAAQLVAYVNDHLFEDISIQSVADAFFCSPSQAGRVFRQATGSSLWEYVSLKRLLSARALLQRGEPASKVCHSCGFKDYSSFFRAYKARFHRAPKDDRPDLKSGPSAHK